MRLYAPDGMAGATSLLDHHQAVARLGGEFAAAELSEAIAGSRDPLFGAGPRRVYRPLRSAFEPERVSGFCAG